VVHAQIQLTKHPTEPPKASFRRTFPTRSSGRGKWGAV